MKRIKKFWNDNRVLCVLFLIVVLCFAVSCGVMIRYFFGGNTSSYGDRLDDIANFPFDEEKQETLKTAIKAHEPVNDVTVLVKGKIIYIRISFTGVGLDVAKDVANRSLEAIAPEYQDRYDLEYTVVEDATETQAGFILMGAKNINREKIIWNNTTPVPETPIEE